MKNVLRIKMGDKDVLICLSSETVNLSTVRNQFFLSSTAIVSLSYIVDGHLLGCLMDEPGTTFLLPKNWRKMKFFADSNEKPLHPGSYSSMRLNKLLSEENVSGDLRARIFFMPRGQKALEDPEAPSAEPIKDGIINGACVTPISRNAAVTYAHGSHKLIREYQEGEDDEVNEHSLVEIRHCQNHTIRHIMKVIVVDTYHDFVILRSLDGKTIFENYPYSLSCPQKFDWFLGFFQIWETDDGPQITQRVGQICSVRVDHKGRFLARTSIDSAGPCFSSDRSLVGFVVATVEPMPVTEDDYGTRKNGELQDATLKSADTLIIPGVIISEAYQRYLVKNGLMKVPRDKEREKRRAKRRANDTL